jgi:hypothetical protein
MPFFSSFLRKKIFPGSFLASSSLVIPANKVAPPRPTVVHQPKKLPTARDVAHAVRVISDANGLSSQSELISWSKADIASAWDMLLNEITFGNTDAFAYVRACVATGTAIDLAKDGANFKSWLSDFDKTAYDGFKTVIAAIMKGAELPANELITNVIAEQTAEKLEKTPHVLERSPTGAVFQKIHIVDADGRVLYLRASQRDKLDPLLTLPAKDPDDRSESPGMIARATLNMSRWRPEDGWYVPAKNNNGPRKNSNGNSSPATTKQPSQKTKI